MGNRTPDLYNAIVALSQLSYGPNQFILLTFLLNHKIPKTPYPRAMFSAVQKDSLNDYVYRFLSKEQTDGDLEAIKGLITSN